MPNYDLSELKEFSKALVYGFDPEGSPQALSGSIKFKDMGEYQTSQHLDLFAAYLFAQNEILPQIRSGLDKITPEQITLWLKTIHKSMAKTLLEVYDIRSGEFSQTSVFHWESSAALLDPILLFLSDRLSMSKEALAKQCTRICSVKEDELIAFIKICQKIAKRAIPLSPLQTESIKKATIVKQGSTILSKLQIAYHTDQLSAEEKEAVDRIVRVTLPPESLPKAMQAYSEKFVSQLKKVDASNLDSVVDFLAEQFYALTFTHPFPNANGRTATCFMNMFLRAFGYPSILLRYPGERHDETSIYAKAFAQANQNRDALKALIKHRIIQEQNNPYSNPTLEKVIELRVGLLCLFNRIKSNHPTFNVELAHEAGIAQMPHYIAQDTELPDDEKSILLLCSLIAYIENIEKNLDEKKRMSIDPEDIRAKLITISGQTGWKSYPKHSVFLLENQSEELIRDLATRLEAINVAKLTVTRRQDNQMPVLKVEQVQGRKLLEYRVNPMAPTSEEQDDSKKWTLA